MKKTILLTIVAMVTMLFGLQAQTEAQTDVTAEQLNAVLQDIHTKLGMLQDLSSRLAAVEQKLGIETDVENPEQDPEDTHEWVDLGVEVDGKPVYWATTNIGATRPAQCGLYFAWGDTVGYSQTFKLTSHTFSSENYTPKPYDGQTVLAPKDDAATVNWGKNWRMPTAAELQALFTQCDWEWVVQEPNKINLVSGYKVSNKTDPSKYIILPAAGHYYDDADTGKGSNGYYWSATSSPNGNNVANNLYFLTQYKDVITSFRYYGLPIRPVRNL